jgi:hypothetical protein
MDAVAEGALNPGVLVQAHAPPGIGDGMKTRLIGRYQCLEFLGGLPRLLIDRSQCR